MLSIHVLRQATALATSVCVLRIYKIVEVFEDPRVLSVNVFQCGKLNPARRQLCDCAWTSEKRSGKANLNPPPWCVFFLEVGSQEGGL